MRKAPLFLLAALALAAGCHKAYSPEAAYDESVATGGRLDYEIATESMPSRAKSSNRAGAAPPAPSAAPMAYAAAMESDAAPPVPEPVTPVQSAVERKVHYNGWARVRVARTEDLVKQVADLATGAGGAVETMDPRRITVRVPVEKFHAVFAQVLGLGDVLDKSVTAEDITEAWSEVDLRLQTARATRERLMSILARTKDEKQKIQILKQIQRLTEEIDGLESRLKVLSTLAAFSRITVEGVPRQAVENRSMEDEIAGFEWIRALSPFRRDVAFSGKALRLDVPEGFVLLDDRKHFVAESADGAVVWAARLDDVPRGDAAFWIEAVRSRLSPEFSSAAVSTLGTWQVLRLVDPSAAIPQAAQAPASVEDTTDGGPYVYLVAIQVVGDERWLVEVYFTSPAQETRYGPAVRAAIQGRVG
jgi:hypothetical protein